MLLMNPDLRDNIEVIFRDFSDIEMQKKEWLSDTSDKGYWNILLHYILTELFHNDTHLQITNENEVGSIFYNEEETEMVKKFNTRLKNLVDEIGENQSDSSYIGNSKWLALVEEAKGIYKMMRSNDLSNNFFEHFRIFAQSKTSSC